MESRLFLAVCNISTNKLNETLVIHGLRQKLFVGRKEAEIGFSPEVI